MHICTGLSSLDNIGKFIECGADEFYCGVVDKVWLDNFNYIVPLNRRPWPDANLSSFEQLEKVVEMAHEAGAKVFYTLNDHCYNDQQIEYLDYYIDNAVECKVDAIIFADIGLAKYCRNRHPNIGIQISTGGVVFNKYSIDFYINELNVERIILPREVSLNEIKLLTKYYKDVEFEVFIKNEGCTYIDGLCNFIHGINYLQSGEKKLLNPPCNLEQKILTQCIKSPYYEKKDLEDRLKKITTTKKDCGLCAIFYLKKYNVTSLKLVGRDTGSNNLLNDILRIKDAVYKTDEINNFKEFYKYISKDKCNNILDQKEKVIRCYYPEILDYINK